MRPQRKIFALNHRPASLAPDKGSPFLAAQLEPGAVLAKFADFELEQPVERLRSLPVAQVRQSAWPAAVETRSDPNPSRCHRITLKRCQLGAGPNVYPAAVVDPV